MKTLSMSLAVMGLAFGMIAWTPAAIAPAPGVVSIVTEPAGVAVYNVLPEGDDFVCQSPCEATFPRGTVTLKARHPGMREVVTAVKIGARPADARMQLEVLPGFSFVRVEADPVFDEIEVDGVRVLTRPAWAVLPYGEHTAVGKVDGRIVSEVAFETRAPRFDLYIGSHRPVN